MKHSYYAFLSFSLSQLISFWIFGFLFVIRYAWCLLLGVYSLICGNGFMMVLGFIGHYTALGYLQEFIVFSFVQIIIFPYSC